MADESDNPSRQPERDLNVSAQLQHLRNLLNSDRVQSLEHQRRVETIEQEISLRSNALERERRDRDALLRDREVPLTSGTFIPSSSPSSLVRSRRRAFRPSERLQRHRELYNQSARTESSDAIGTSQRTDPPLALSEGLAEDHTAESQVNREQRFRAKRRKLDDGTFDDETRVISYGDEGRVTPGLLKMEILGCDGGDYSESTSGSAQLVLQDDTQVYSTKENKCNMLFKHIGGMPFSLTKVTIKAPSDGFDSPIQEGMIFVAMNDDQLLDKTSQYDKYSPRSYRSHVHRRHDLYRPSDELLTPMRSPLRPMNRSRHLGDPQPPWSRNNENELDIDASTVPGFEISFEDPSDHEDSPSLRRRSPVSWRDFDAEFSLRAYADRYRPPNSNNDTRDNASVTSNESGDEYVPAHQERANVGASGLDEAFAQHRRYANYIRTAHEGEDPGYYLVHSNWRPRHEWRRFGFPSSPPSRAGPRTNGDSQATPLLSTTTISKPPTELSSRTLASASETLAPHARFSMGESQTSIAINFDPPVAGRYLLIKLWASCPASNIDIQCIIPHGYGGPRFFPSIETR